MQKPDCIDGEILGEVNGKYYCLKDEEPRAEYMMEDGQSVKINYDDNAAPAVLHDHFSNGMSNNCPEPPPCPACEKCVEPSFDCKTVLREEEQQPIKLPEFEEPPLSYGLFRL